MPSRDFGSQQPQPLVTLGKSFTPDELKRLDALRQNYTGHAEHSELMIDPLHLEFMRWLYEQGRLSDDLSSPDAPSLTQQPTTD
jgi:hypothetical protein